ncbi:MAG: MarR family transcriptional regulator [Breznakibacter sp.]
MTDKQRPHPPAPDANGYPQLKLENQLCFPFYAASMLITRKYQPLLDELSITYPQYLVLLILWERGALTVGQISSSLLLNTNTITPLLKRMEKSGLLERKRSDADERQVLVSLSDKGTLLRERAALIPYKLLERIDYPIEKAVSIMKEIKNIIDLLQSDSTYNKSINPKK